MQARCVAAAAALAAVLACSEGRAQAVVYPSGLTSYTINPGAYNPGGPGPFNPGSSAEIAASGFLVGSSFGNYALPAPYGGYPSYVPWQGYSPLAGSGQFLYPGYRGFRGYGYLSYGRGRTFGGYPPRFYPTYQPRLFGRFDR